MIDVRTYGAVPDGTTDCSTAINSAVAAGNIIIRNGTFLLTASIKIPSNRTIYLSNAKLKMADESYDNVFRNSDFTNGNSNINIIGLDHAVLDGNSPNNDDDYATLGINSDVSYRYNFIMLYRVNTFQIKNICVADRSHYAFFISQSSNGIIDNIYLNIYKTTVNQDGIDLLYGVNNIAISNLKGHGADDFIAIGALTPDGTPAFNPHIGDYTAGDAHDISIENVRIYNSGIGSLLALIAGSGKKIYNIDVSDAINYSAGSAFYYSYQEFRTVAPIKSDVRDITMDNITVIANTRSEIFSVGDPCQDITVTNFTDYSGDTLYAEDAGLDVDRFLINGVDQS